MHESTLSSFARQQHGLVKRSQLIEAGVPRTTIDTWVAHGRLERLLPAVYRVAGVPSSWEQQVLAATLGTGGIASHRTAARIWGLLSDDVIEVTVPAGGSARVRGVVVHRLDTALKPSIRRGIRVTNPLDTLSLLGAVASRDVVESALHEALIQRLVTITAAKRALTRIEHPGRRGPSMLRAILDDWELGIRPPDSVLEIRVGAVFRRYSLPPVEFQHKVELAGGKSAQIDFAYPHVKLAVEVEGNERHTLPLDRERDRVRKRKLTRLGWTVIEFSWLEVVRKPATVASSIAEELARLSAA